MDLLKFEEALVHAKEGKRLTRLKWNGNNLEGDFNPRMWVVVMPALYLHPYNTQDTMRKVNDRTAKHIGIDTPLDSKPYFALFTPDKTWQPGWLPSQQDLFAEDYIVLEDEDVVL